MASIEILQVAPRAGQLRVRLRITEEGESPGRYDVALLLTEVDGTRRGRDEWVLSFTEPVDGLSLLQAKSKVPGDNPASRLLQDEALAFRVTHRDVRAGEHSHDFGGAAVISALTSDDAPPARVAVYAYMIRRDTPFEIRHSPRNAESTYVYVASDFA